MIDRDHVALETVGELGKETPTSHNPLEWLNDKFYSYIEDRRREPRDDVLTELAQAKYPDGSTPEIIDVINVSTFLFAAGTETTTKPRFSRSRLKSGNLRRVNAFSRPAMPRTTGMS